MFPHITELARIHGSELLLVHVADGWAARNYNRFELADSEEMKVDRAYLETMAAELRTGVRGESTTRTGRSRGRNSQDLG